MSPEGNNMQLLFQVVSPAPLGNHEWMFSAVQTGTTAFSILDGNQGRAHSRQNRTCLPKKILKKLLITACVICVLPIKWLIISIADCLAGTS